MQTGSLSSRLCNTNSLLKSSLETAKSLESTMLQITTALRETRDSMLDEGKQGIPRVEEVVEVSNLHHTSSSVPTSTLVPTLNSSTVSTSSTPLPTSTSSTASTMVSQET